MSIYVVTCPNCGSSDGLEKDDNLFECECGEEFEIDNAKIIECKSN